MSTSVRDTQRQKVYNWERTHVRGYLAGDLTLEQIQTWLARICGDHDLPAPQVGDGRGRRRAYCELTGSDGMLKFPRWARSLPMVCHEAAHYLHLRWCRSRRLVEAAHGPEFMRVYLDLLGRYAKLPLKPLVETARRAGLKVAPNGAVIQPMDRTEKRLLQAREGAKAAVQAARVAYETACAELFTYRDRKAQQARRDVTERAIATLDRKAK